MPKVELMGQILPNLDFLLVVDPKTIFFWFCKKSLSGRVFSRHVRFHNVVLPKSYVHILTPLVPMFHNVHEKN